MSKNRLQPIHPGEILREEFLNPMGYSQREFAVKIGVTHTRLNQIVQEKRSITADTALRLARALGTTAEFWMNLQARFDLDLAMDESGAQIEKEVERIPTP
ncbi:MAG: HigA family addiction module antitoxin [Bacteroidota bacterium]